MQPITLDSPSLLLLLLLLLPGGDDDDDFDTDAHHNHAEPI